jgi:hypothetical protein
MERLGDIIVGAGVEAVHLVAPAIARGQDQHRHHASAAAPGFQHRDAVHLRQADIEDDGVVRLALAEVMAFLAVERPVDGIAGVRQRAGELAVQVRIVFNDKQPQDCPLTDL